MSATGTASRIEGPGDVREVLSADAHGFRSDVVDTHEPAVLRAVASDWPMVGAAAGSTEAAVAYLEKFDGGAQAEAFVGPPEIGGRFFYRDGVAGFNFEKRAGPLRDIVRAIASLERSPDPPAIYAGAVPLAEVLPGLERENPMPILEGTGAVPRIWIGNRTIVSAHFDDSDNVAIVVAGRRRFTLFPPEQVANLYVGPLDFTMAGQPASMVDVRNPDLARYPRFAEAMAVARVAELEPGDAIYIPALWWHHVEALDPFNILINYWWKSVPVDAGSPFESMIHGILAISDLPEHQRDAWRAMFDHYVFRRNGDPAGHLPDTQKGILGKPTPQLRARIRQFLLHMLSRQS